MKTNKLSNPSVKQSGFTLIEIMVVVMIIGLLSALILPNLVDNQDRALRVATKAKINQVSSSLALYKLDNYSYPTTSEGLQALITNPGKKNWSGYGYAGKLPKDAWEREFQYLQPGQKNTTSYDIWSYGADGVAGGEGNNRDIGNWDEE